MVGVVEALAAIAVTMLSQQDPIRSVWHSEPAGQHVYLDLRHESVVIRYVVRAGGTVDTSRGRWETHQTGNPVELCIHITGESTFSCAAYYISTMSVDRGSGLVRERQLTIGVVTFREVPEFDIGHEVSALRQRSDSLRTAKQATADSILADVWGGEMETLARDVTTIADRGSSSDRLRAHALLSQIQAELATIGLTFAVQGLPMAGLDSLQAELRRLIAMFKSREMSGEQDLTLTATRGGEGALSVLEG